MESGWPGRKRHGRATRKFTAGRQPAMYFGYASGIEAAAAAWFSDGAGNDVA